MAEFFYTRVRTHDFTAGVDLVEAPRSSCYRGFVRSRVVTLVEPDIRSQIDSIARSTFDAFHTSSEQQALQEICKMTVGGFLFSPKTGFVRERAALLDSAYALPGIWILPVRRCAEPYGKSNSVPFLHAPSIPLNISASSTIDVLRSVTRPRQEGLLTDLLASLAPVWRDVPVEVRRFFVHMFRVSPDVTSARALARLFGVRETTLSGAFFRAGAPSAKTYLALFRLLQVSALLENDAVSVASASVSMNYSSPQSLCRHVTITLGMTARSFRRLGFHQLLTHVVRKLFIPFRAELCNVLPYEVGKIMRNT